MADKVRTPEELEALKQRARKWAETEGPAAIKRAIECANAGAKRMEDAQRPLDIPTWLWFVCD